LLVLKLSFYRFDSFYRPESLLLFTPMSKASLEDSFYVVDRPALESVQQAKAWHEGEGAKHPKYFKRVLISAGATIKMMQHAMRGVERGMASDNGMPVEVMGLLLGRPSTDPEDPHYMVVTDAFPLPVDGVETRVEAGDEAMNFMIGLYHIILTFNIKTVIIIVVYLIIAWHHKAL